MKTIAEVETELKFQKNKLKLYPIGSPKYMDTQNIINTLHWVLKTK